MSAAGTGAAGAAAAGAAVVVGAVVGLADDALVTVEAGVPPSDGGGVSGTDVASTGRPARARTAFFELEQLTSMVNTTTAAPHRSSVLTPALSQARC